MSAQAPVPNDLFRDARVHLFGSREALANAANEIVPASHLLTANDIGKIELGKVTWPRSPRRQAFRHLLQVATDAEIGLFDKKKQQPTATSSLPPSPALDLSLSSQRLVILGVASPPQVLSRESSIRPHPLIPRTRTGRTLASRPTATASDQGTESAHSRLADAGPSAQVIYEELFESLDSADNDWNSFSRVTSMLAQQRQAVAPMALLSLVEAHRDCLSTLLRNAGSDPVRVKIGAMLGEASVVASRLWSAQGNRAMALAHCAYARRLADRLRNPFLGATARIFESNLHSDASSLIDADGDAIAGLRLLEEAASAACHLSAPARARIAAEQAQTYAALELRREASLALEHARQAAAEIQPGDCVGLYSDWNQNRVRVYEGTCQLLLDEPVKAVDTLESVLHELKDDRQNTNVLLAAKVDLASSYAAIGKLAMGCSILGDTYEQLKIVGNLRGIRRAERAREKLSAWVGNPAVRQLDVRMMAA
ncbi:hypothetical protein [Actinoplanes sp. GCM10030250]|uniref:hypothetical protein n=1 Tax=Actinoplanes sp. GCM10030250 TaxID=3273376 RepID=UPI003605AD5A